MIILGFQTFVYERHFSKWKKRKKKSKPQITLIVFKTSSFLQDVFSKVNHSGNQDIGEGMFDGLMQVMVCGVSENVDPYRYHIDTFFIDTEKWPYDNYWF